MRKNETEVRELSCEAFLTHISCNSRVLNLVFLNRLCLRMLVCTLCSSSGAAELQRVAVLITQLGFPLYPVRGRG